MATHQSENFLRNLNLSRREIPGFQESRKLDPYYYLNDFWNDIADPVINDKPLMSGGPWGWLAAVCLLIFWIRVLGPRSMKDKPAKDLRPLLIILNGFTFGCYITGMATGIVYSDWGLAAFNCNSLNSDQTVDNWIRKTAGYCFLMGKIWDFLRPILAVYRKRDNEITNMYLFHCFCSVFFVFLGLKFHPGGIFIFLPYLDGLYQIFAYGYLIKAAASDFFKPSYAYRLFLYRFKLVTGVALIVHGLYYLSVPNCGPDFLKYFQIMYATIGLIVGPSDFQKMEQLRDIRISNKQQSCCHED